MKECFSMTSIMMSVDDCILLVENSVLVSLCSFDHGGGASASHFAIRDGFVVL